MTKTNDEAEACPDCGYLDDSFACRIRHQHVNFAHLKRERESRGPNFGLTEQPK